MIIKQTVVILLLLQQLHGATIGNKTGKAYKELFKRTIVGYDCSRVQNISSHKINEMISCEDNIIENAKTNIEVQVLQKSNKFTNQAMTCSIRRTTKISHCGAYHHSLNLNSHEMTYEPIPVAEKTCKDMLKYRKYKFLDLGENKSLDLELNKEHVLKYYEKGYQLPGTEAFGSSILCGGEKHTFGDKMISNVVIHHTDVITITNTTLLIENQDIVDTSNRRILECRKEKETCSFDNVRYIWALKEPNCKLYQVKSLQGQVSTLNSNASNPTAEEYSKFTANGSLIELTMKGRITICDRNLYKTDFANIFILKVNEELPIEQNIEPIHISILTEVGIRNKYIYSRLKTDIGENIKMMATYQCKHNQISQLQLTRLHSRIRSNHLEVFSIYPNSGRFICTVGETIYHFTCPRMLFRPIFLNEKKCFNNLPVRRLERDLVETNNTLFLTPFERIVTRSPGEIPCTKEFKTKFELADGNWVAMNENGLYDVTAPSLELPWLNIKYSYKNTIDNVIFDLGKGLYSFNDIQRYNKLIAFSGKRSTTLRKVTNQLAPEVFNNRRIAIQPTHMFKKLQWRDYVSNMLEKFGRYSAICVAVWTLLAMVKGCIHWCNGIWLVKKITNSSKQTAKYAISPSYYLLKGLGKRHTDNGNSGYEESHFKDPIIRNPPGKEMQHHPMQNNQATLQELRKLNDELPNYQKPH